MLKRMKFKLFYKLSFLFISIAVISIFATTYSIVVTAYEFHMPPDFIHAIEIAAVRNIFVMFLTFTFIALGLARLVIAPLEEVRRFVRSLASGDFWGELKLNTNDELEMLAEDINNLAGDLKQHQETLKEEVQSATEALLLQNTRLEAILNSITDGLIMTYLNGKTFLLNPKAREFLGVQDTGGSSKESRMLWDIVPDKEFSLSLKKIFEDAAAAVKPFEHDISLPEKRTFRVSPSDVKDEKGNLYGKVFILHDITREKEVDRMKSDFVSTVSHELRTPLTSMSGFVSTLLREDLSLTDETKRDFLKSIKTATDRLSRLINDLLDVSRIEAGKIDLNKLPFSVSRLVSRVMQGFKAHGAHHEFIVKTPEELSRVMADEDKIQQVLENLIGNAVKYSPHGSKITIYAGETGNKIKVSVSDEGVGIPEEQKELIFNRFHRVDNSLVRKSGGTGLGLYICRRILEAHEERIWIENTKPGEGSTFSFTLPKMQ